MGQADFEAYYQTAFGVRWPALRTALLAHGARLDFKHGLTSPYRLDAASVAAACALRLPAVGQMLDACAAPGGKSLVLASRLGTDRPLLANELSSERRRRLHDVLDQHLAAERRSLVTVSGFDAAAAGGRTSEHGRFGAILLDAPCSSERHVLADDKALGQWSAARVRFLAQRQWSLLSSAFLLLVVGGSLVYSTCALSTAENDEVVGRLMKKQSGKVAVDLPPDNLAAALAEAGLSPDGCRPVETGTDNLAAEIGSDQPAVAGLDDWLGTIQAETTTYGRLYLPDTARGAGPLYIARLVKLA
ncbi:MAG: hypothetical protein A2087_10165 [Spirochaetes bacterium GWD1_61_31]|nr:MAG: hypothetical protein A2Y37_12350 [Spirochaetes bacterium GWB1_60_80]OHD30161.1 MAG: hypothetical protein A2004_14215 [Spirochaetes bacterium GWC1_61_12]OHD34583.1 MAG: hypothetical protein A2087_10165 [Spirochaetes bacterium GWD1_61_31]OHD46399.1 MAG: hypothetical protein A2Y35_10070 [Spirochaetes bacterium GWE1_60_18]OHD59455.1 MAG: hypothetical protein A2Y32_10025 [Spirochaetes bacterium GWF1_60_12]HAP43553.1 16S rRNA methyltransferase [Spirochaetaceae bacterium]